MLSLYFGEPPYGVLGSQENGVQNNQGARSRGEKYVGSRGTNLGSREQRKKSTEKVAEENNQGATQKFFGEQGDRRVSMPVKC